MSAISGSGCYPDTWWKVCDPDSNFLSPNLPFREEIRVSSIDGRNGNRIARQRPEIRYFRDVTMLRVKTDNRPVMLRSLHMCSIQRELS